MRRQVRHRQQQQQLSINAIQRNPTQSTLACF